MSLATTHGYSSDIACRLREWRLQLVVRSGSELAEEIKRFGRERLPAYAYPLLVGSPASCRRP